MQDRAFAVVRPPFTRSFPTVETRPSEIWTVGLPGGEARIINMETRRQLIDTTPRTPGWPSVPTQTWQEVGAVPDGVYGWAEVQRLDGSRERWLLEACQWHRKLDDAEPDPVIEEREIIGAGS